jgi:hypothetical protein
MEPLPGASRQASSGAPPADTLEHVPVSMMLDALLDRAPAEVVTIEWLIGELRERSFGLVLLLMALIALVPGGSTFIGVLLAYPALQMIAGREGPTLPRVVAARKVSVAQLAKAMRRAIGALKGVERFIRPRWRISVPATKRVVGIVVLLLAPTLIWPFPFSHVIPAIVIGMISLAYLENDGLLLCIAAGAAVVSLAITAATVWASITTTNLFV